MKSDEDFNEQITKDIHEIDKALVRLIESHKATSSNVGKLASSMDKVLEMLPHVQEIKSSMKAMHKRLDRVEERVEGVDVMESDIRLLKRIIFTIITSTILAVGSKIFEII